MHAGGVQFIFAAEVLLLYCKPAGHPGLRRPRQLTLWLSFAANLGSRKTTHPDLIRLWFGTDVNTTL